MNKPTVVNRILSFRGFTSEVTIRDVIRFESHLIIPDDPKDCWDWKGSFFSSGYPVFHWLRQNRGAHKFSYQLYNGQLIDGMYVCHHCDNKRCVNPNHLFFGTCRDNKHDSMGKGRHAFGERQGSSVVTDEMVRYFKALLAIGFEPQEIARLFGVSRAIVSSVKIGRTWAHVDRSTIT